MDWYLVLKTLHIVSIIAWMAGLFYLPRLFAYHALEAPDSPTALVFQTMEKRLYQIIMMPSMILSLTTGLSLVVIMDVGSAGWLHFKLLFVAFLVFFHLFFDHCRKQLALGLNRKSPRFFRLIHEIPGVLLILIIICVVFKPF